MKVVTSCFGEVNIDGSRVITMREGLLGFEHLHRYVFLAQDEKIPFWVFQSVDNTSVAFVLINPFWVNPEYDPVVSESDRKQLEIESDHDVMVFSIVTIHSDPHKVTVNLRAPIVINMATRLARQVVLANDEYGVQHPLIGKNPEGECSKKRESEAPRKVRVAASSS